MAVFQVEFTAQTNVFDIGFESSETFNADFDNVIFVHEAEIYSGAYEVTPRLYLQSLDTNGKLMRHDVTVYEIPVTQTSNPYGGQTVLIG